MGANLHVRRRIYQPDGILNVIKVFLSPENGKCCARREKRKQGKGRQEKKVG